MSTQNSPADMPSTPTLTVTVGAEFVAQIELSRPEKLNSITSQMFTDLITATRYLDKRDDVRVIVLCAKGRGFCSGIDLKSLSVFEDNEACPARVRSAALENIKHMQAAFTAFEECRKPVIAAVHGPCFGGGIDMITACDIRYCTDDTTFCVKEIDLAITADLGTLQRLPTLVGAGRSTELALTARVFAAPEAHSIGLVSSTFPTREAMMTEVMKVARTLASKSPLASQGTKATCLHAREHSVADGLEYVAWRNAAVLISADLTEAVTAFFQKKKPTFAKL